ncbi:MAG: asparaginase, partial [Treponema sp.]|nr:asparaginase [Treponema sp.]
QSFVYLETRIQFPHIPNVFSLDSKTKKVSINETVLHHVFLLAKALGSSIIDNAILERLTGNIHKEETGKEILGYSVKCAEGGSVNILFHSKKKSIHIQEIRIEEDTGRLSHAAGLTKMDYTHAASPSIRIHTTPSFETGEEAELFLEEFCRLMQYLNIAPEQTKESIRCNAFVSLSEYPELPDYYVKLRNLNSFNFVRKAINNELTRQENILAKGEQVPSESRSWNEAKSCTDFFHTRPEIVARFENVSPQQIIPLSKYKSRLLENIKDFELPEERRTRFKNQYKLNALTSEILCDDKALADFFESSVKEGSDAELAARFISSEVYKLLKQSQTSSKNMKLTAQSFSKIMQLLSKKKIHTGSAKRLIRTSFETGQNAEDLLKELSISELNSKKDILLFVKKIVQSNKELCKKIQQGELQALEYLTGLVIKQSNNMALPQLVKSLLIEELNIQTIYLLSMGGAFSAVQHSDGIVASGNTNTLRNIATKCTPNIPLQIISIAQFLSEEIEPHDWAVLISEIAKRIHSGIAKGIVITHGCDTLSYTASLLFWLFSDAPIPIVLTASSSLPSESSESEENLTLALKTAEQKKQGVYVAFGGKIMSALNLRFIQPGKNGFKNWNLKKAVFTNSGPIAEQFSENFDYDKKIIERLLVEASGKMLVCKIYPGFRSDIYRKLLTNRIHSVFLELYESGAGNMRSNDFSLKPF